jgi:hypothetical protein
VANAEAITIRDLVANSELADPAPNALDTGTDPVTLPCAVGGVTDQVIFRVKNLAAEDLTVTVKAGDNPPAMRAPLGDVDSSVIAQNATRWLGPFESGRFCDEDGDLNLTFTPGGTINTQVTAFRLPTP